MKDPQYDEFRQIVFEVMQLGGPPFIVALYRVLDHMTAEAIKKDGIILACHAGCGFCCHQLVCSTSIEWKAISDYVLTLPEKSKYNFQKRSKRLTLEWRRYWQDNEKLIRLGAKFPHSDWLGKDCPFLNDQQMCDIYPVKPIDCRTMTSTLVCADWYNLPGVKRMQFPWEQSANNWILEKEGMTATYLMDFLYNTPHLWQ